MDTNDPSTPQVAPQYIDLPDDPPAWPKVIGIISIVLGSLGLLCNGCGGAMLVATPYLLQMGEEQFGPAPDVLKPPMAQIALLPIALIMSILLLVAGISLVRRKAAARLMHLVYAVVTLINTGIGAVIGMGTLQKLAAWKAANASDQWAGQINMGQQYFTFAFAIALGLAYPAFLLIWFGLVKKKASDMGQLPEVL